MGQFHPCIALEEMGSGWPCGSGPGHSEFRVAPLSGTEDGVAGLRGGTLDGGGGRGVYEESTRGNRFKGVEACPLRDGRISGFVIPSPASSVSSAPGVPVGGQGWLTGRERSYEKPEKWQASGTRGAHPDGLSEAEDHTGLSCGFTLP